MIAIPRWLAVGVLLSLWCFGLVRVYRWSETAIPLYLTGTILIGLLTVGLGRRGNRSEKSAYSVFNQECERLPGQLTAEQFEAEIQHKEVGRPSRTTQQQRAETEEQRFQRLLRETRQGVRRDAARRRR
mmetsp:Transcript_1665/g.5013  ORF Transcript_1665/g.5013 Transcript_1665/m.5013 type:complete len:129 (+) Transcript_1665:74-460(+)